MSQLIIKEFKGKQIRVREDGYFSATDMCQAAGKLFADWKRLNATSEYLDALETAMGNPITSLVQVIQGIPQGGTPQDQGTWVHRRVAIRLAQWCSPTFAVQVDSWIEELFMTGTVSIKQQKQQQQPKVNEEPEKLTAKVLESYVKSIATLQNNGDVRLAALAKSILGNVMQQNLELQTLPAVEERVEGAVECAIRLGFVVPKNYESTLGKHVKKQCEHLLKGVNQRFSYTSNQSVPANMYPYGNIEVENAVRSYCVEKAFKNNNLILGGDIES